MRSVPKEPSEFIAEVTEIVDVLERDLSQLDGRGSLEVRPDLVNGIFRAAHSLKGMAGMFGQDRIAHLAHKCEDLLDRLRLGRVTLSAEVVNALNESVDVFQALLGEAARDERTPFLSERVERLAARLEQLNLTSLPPSDDLIDQLELDPVIRNALTDYEVHRLQHHIKKGTYLWRVRALFNLADFDQGLFRLNAALKQVGEVITTLPAIDTTVETSIAFDLVLGSTSPREELESALAGFSASLGTLTKPESAVSATDSTIAPAHFPHSPEAIVPLGKGSMEVREGPSGTPALELAGPTQRALEGSLRTLTQTVRVDIHRLDALMNAVGDLLLIKTNIQVLAESAR